MSSVNWNSENIFLCFTEFVCSVIGRAWQRVKGHYRPTVRWLVFLGTPQDTLLPWLQTRDVHKHTYTRQKTNPTALARGSDQGRDCLPSELHNT